MDYSDADYGPSSSKRSTAAGRRSSKDRRTVPPVKIKLKRKQPADELGTSEDEPESHQHSTEDDEQSFVVEPVQRPVKRSDRVSKKSKKETESAASARLLDSYDFAVAADSSPVAPTTTSSAAASPSAASGSRKSSRRLNKSTHAAPNTSLQVPPAAVAPPVVDFVNNEYCEVCRFGGEIILCDTCPRSYHLVCLDPELDAVPEGQWSCPKCVRDALDPNQSSAAADSAVNTSSDADVNLLDEKSVFSAAGVVTDDEVVMPPAHIERKESTASASDHHMEHCKECKQTGELLCCDTCPLAYHLYCLVPPLKAIPQGKWDCPRCTCEPLPGKIQKIVTWRWKEINDETEDDDTADEGDANMPSTAAVIGITQTESITVTNEAIESGADAAAVVVPPQAADAAASSSAPAVDQPVAPQQESAAPAVVSSSGSTAAAPPTIKSSMSAKPLALVVTNGDDDQSKNIDEPIATAATLTTVTITPPSPTIPNAPVSIMTKKKKHEQQHRIREFFIKWEGYSYWHCSWVTQLQMEVHAPQMLRSYTRKQNDMSEPPPSQEFPDDRRGEHRKELEIEERFLRYGIKPEWLQVQRILNHRINKRDGSVEFLCKWRDLGYHQAAWEREENEIVNFQQHVDYYVELRSAYDASMGKRPLKKLIKRRKNESTFQLPPEKPSTNLHVKWVEQPEFLNESGNLHEYQLEGINWLRHSWANSTNVILADEMGLGKTIQTIVFLYSLYKEGHSKGPFLVSVPLSTLVNWEREFELWAPDFYVLSYIGDRESRAVMREHEFSFEENIIRAGPKACRMRTTTSNKKGENEMPAVKFHVLLTSYEMVTMDQALLSSIQWRVLVVDEAHRLKSAQSKFFRILSQYDIDYKLLLTGTPLQNTLEELFHLLNFMDKYKFPHMNLFLNEFADIAKEEQIQKLHELLGTHMLRRLKADVLKSMPSKRELIVRVELSQMQKRYYKAVLTRNFDTLSHRGSGSGGQCSLLNIVMDLKKVCNHPYLFPAAAADAPRLPTRAFEGSALVTASGKLVLLAQMLKKLKDAGHRVLIFSQMTRMLDLLEDFCDAEGYRYERLDGSITGSIRQEGIDRFNAAGAQQFVFLLSTRAGGLGINLATADTVIIYDSDWNPHNDIQAFSRAHRLGQAKKVMIYRFVTRGSVEERVTQVAKRKMMLTHLVVRPGMGSSAAGSGAFSKKDLDDILRFGTTELFKDDEEVARAAQQAEEAANQSKDGEKVDAEANATATNAPAVEPEKNPPPPADNVPWTRRTTALESNEIHYDDAAIDALLDRSQVDANAAANAAAAAAAVEAGGDAAEQNVMNEYLGSFKVATYSLRQGPVNEPEAVAVADTSTSSAGEASANSSQNAGNDSATGGASAVDSMIMTDSELNEVLKQEATENQDPSFWEKLLRHHYEHNKEEASQRMGRGKRERKQVRYANEGRGNSSFYAGAANTAVAGVNADRNYDDDHLSSSSSDGEGEGGGGDNDGAGGGGAGGRRSQRAGKKEEKLPPMLARVNGSIEVYGFNARQRKAYLNAVLRYGLPPPDAYEKQWLVKDLRTKSEQAFQTYTQMFLRHLCEPGAEHGECFSDGVPREGVSRPLTLQRIGVMSLVRKKVREFEGVNGTHSLPELAEQLIVEKRVAEQRARDDKLAAKKEKAAAVILTTATSNAAGGTTLTTDATGFFGSVAPASPTTGKADEKDENVAKNLSIDAEGDSAMPEAALQRLQTAAEPMRIDENLPVENVAPSAGEESMLNGSAAATTYAAETPVITMQEKARHDKRKIMFNIADAGFTELHTLWQNEERALVTHRTTQPHETEIWNRKHDYWLLSGVSKHGYARWNEICNDSAYEILNLPFQQAPDYFDVKTKFIARRFKLLESALVVEEQVRRCAYMQHHLYNTMNSVDDAAADPNGAASDLTRHYSKMEMMSAAYQQLTREASSSSTAAASNKSTASGILRSVLHQLYDLLGEMKNDMNRLPAQIVNVTPSFQKLQLSERTILNRLVTQPSTSNGSRTVDGVKNLTSSSSNTALDGIVDDAQDKNGAANGTPNGDASDDTGSQPTTKEDVNEQDFVQPSESNWQPPPASYAFQVEYGPDMRKIIEKRKNMLLGT